MFEPSETDNFSQSKTNSFLVPLAIVIAGGLVAGALWFQSRQNNNPTAAVVGQKTLQKKIDIDAGDLPILGDANAKVEVIVFGDYQCPFCERFFNQTEQQIREQYVKIGKVKIAWRDFAFLGVESFWAAEAARCANDQEKFWQFHDLLFLRQQGENQGVFNKDMLKGFAAELGLNQGEFDSCLDGGKYTQAVKNDTETGRAAGVESTPSASVNGELIVGAQPLEIFKSAIEKYLK